MNNSHIEEHLKRLTKWVELRNGNKLNDQDKSFFADLLNLTWGDGYQRAAEVADESRFQLKHKLSLEHFEWFIKVHRSHMKAFGTDNQIKYRLENVRKVKFDSREDCIKVYYEDTWWHYTREFQWY